WVNDHIPFAHFEVHKTYNLPSQRQEEEGEVPQADFTTLSLKVHSAQVAVQSTRVRSDGKLAITVQSLVPQVTDYLELHFEYQDVFNHLMGVFPMELVPVCDDFGTQASLQVDGINGVLYVNGMNDPNSTLYYQVPALNMGTDDFYNYSSVAGIPIAGFLKKGDTGRVILKNERGCEKTVSYKINDLIYGQPHAGGIIVYVNPDGQS